MVQTNISLPEKQHKWLQQHAKKRGLSMAEVIRRALDSYEVVHDSKIEPGSDRAKYVQFVGEHMNELVDAVLEGMASREMRKWVGRRKGDRMRELEERGELVDWILDEGKFQDEAQDSEQPTED